MGSLENLQPVTGMDEHPWPCVVHRSVRDCGACQTFAGDAGRSLSGMAGGAPPTSVGVATRVSQERRSLSRSKLASGHFWPSQQARAMRLSWPGSSPCVLSAHVLSM